MDYVADETIVLDAFFARSSFASAFAVGKVEDIFSAAIPSTFQRRQVRQDFLKTFAEILPQTNFDILLVDFTDERFPLYVLDDGRVVTVSAELGRTAFPLGITGRLVKPFTDEHFELWERGWSHFIELMNESGFCARIRINRALWCEKTESGARFDPQYPPEAIEAANTHFKRLFHRCSSDLSECSFYDYDVGQFIGKDDHKWGRAPFHYADAFYLATLAHLQHDRVDTGHRATRSC